MKRDEIRYAEYGTEEPYDVLIVAYGTVARVCVTALEDLREAGIRAAMVRPVTLFPFPYARVRAAAERAKALLVVELSCGQMVEDVRLAVEGIRPVHFYGRQGGMLVTPEEVVDEARRLLAGPQQEADHA
jgi:2-oxoglutarate ferredoxin oxidoreductase subunit alpha